jgi:hypothetical protein
MYECQYIDSPHLISWQLNYRSSEDLICYVLCGGCEMNMYFIMNCVNILQVKDCKMPDIELASFFIYD